MINRWDYSNMGQVQYGQLDSYVHACNWLDQTGYTVEDWGCGCAFAKRFFKHASYKGIDGSQNDYADVCKVDLSSHSSSPDGILMRHVLDHNENWEVILGNALNSFRKRMSLVFFIEFGPTTTVVSRSQDPKYKGVPDIQFRKSDVMKWLKPYFDSELRIPIHDWLVDTIFFLKK